MTKTLILNLIVARSQVQSTRLGERFSGMGIFYENGGSSSTAVLFERNVPDGGMGWAADRLDAYCCSSGPRLPRLTIIQNYELTLVYNSTQRPSMP